MFLGFRMKLKKYKPYSFVLSFCPSVRISLFLRPKVITTKYSKCNNAIESTVESKINIIDSTIQKPISPGSPHWQLEKDTSFNFGLQFEN